MLTSKLVPMDVAARVVNRDTGVPLLTDSPFASSGVLEKGIHLHWALPDLLTRARTTDSQPPQFRGVPDVWLVVRFNPATGSRRGYRAWVVDAVTERVTPLEQWTAPDDRDIARIHTAPGVLRRVRNGWGEWDMQQNFDALTTAYYPACRTRLGFHDDLADLPAGATGKVSYTVVGWYSRIEFDPFYSDRFQRADKLGHRSDLRTMGVVATTVSRAGRETELRWDAAAPVVQRGARLTLSEVAVAKNSTRVRASAMRTQQRTVESLLAAIPLAPTDPQHVVVDSLMPDPGKTFAVLHGSVMDVPLRESVLTAFSSLVPDKVFLYPTIQRAMAEVAANTGQEQQTDWLDMMLGDLGQQSGSVAGVVDLPGAQHARTFQSVPGKTSYFARLDIYPQDPPLTKQFQLLDLTAGASVAHSGHWPELQARTAAVHYSALANKTPIPSASLNQPPAQPAGPTAAEIVAWIGTLRASFALARQQAETAGTPLDPRLIRVQDRRQKAQPTQQGLSIDGSGPDQAGWWIDMGPDDAPIDIGNADADPVHPGGNPLHVALANLRRSIGGANVHMPDATHLFSSPGPRWYRPWAPHLVVYGAKRSYRHGADGRFRADGHLTTRLAGEAMTMLKVGNATVFGKDLVAPTSSLTVAGVPGVVGELVQEHALADAENAPMMAKTARVPSSAAGAPARQPSLDQMSAAARGLWLSRGNLLKPDQKSVIDNLVPVGTPSSAAGLQLWKDWYGPLFLDTKYTHRRKRFNDAWSLPPEFVEAVERTPRVAPDREQVITERQIATVSIANVLKKSLFSISLDPYGKPVHTKPAPSGVDEDTFEQIDLVSASLAHLDDELFVAGERERGGVVHMNQVRMFDTFGTQANWASDDATLSPLPQWATELPARLSSWGRLNFRVQSALDAQAEATPLTPPICGILLPDFVEQALEVYDDHGGAVGQLTADDPIQDNPGPARTLRVAFTLLPWVAKTLAPGADPTTAISNPTLRRLVQSLVAQALDVQAGAPGWHETGLTAMLRVFDTVRSTLDPAARTSDTRVRLLGEPIVVMHARLFFEASSQTPADLKRNPQRLAEPPALPTLRVRVGDVTRPDDGVLGCFLIGADVGSDRFAPVSLEAAQKAVLNQMVFKGTGQKIEPVTHPFIVGQVAEFDVPGNTNIDTIVLADARGSLYATCGVLPRKTIVLPRDFIEPSLKKLEPTFHVGPLLGFESQGALVPVLPAPKIEGMDAEFVHDDGSVYPAMPAPPVLPVAELPAQRIRLTEGWVRMVRQQKP